ncbi:MAG: hypothetical protein HEQ40_12370 [Lacibacter sp.]|jgi:hypothetical protein
METLTLFANIASIISSIFSIIVAMQLISIKKIIRENSTNNVNQSNSKVSGDMIGRDSKK